MMNSMILQRSFRRLIQQTGKTRAYHHRRGTKNATTSDKPQKGKARGSKGRSFTEVQAARREEAKRCVLVELPQDRIPSLVSHCQMFGPVKQLHLFNSRERNYTLVEFSEPDAACHLVADCVHYPNDDRVSVPSRFLWMPDQLRSKGGKMGHVRVTTESKRPPLEHQLMTANSVSEQMRQLHQNLMMTEMGTRLRHFLGCSLEETITKLFPHAVLHPFGSSVNGCGKYDCDLDLLMLMDPPQMTYQNEALCFMNKLKTDDEHRHSQSMAETLGRILQHFVPHIVNVYKIPRARVPIVKMRHVSTEIDCDLSFSNPTSIQMSEILWTLGEIDNRVRPLVFTIRHWARSHQVTRSAPGPWLSNFMLTLLVIYYLQISSVLPSINHLLELTGFSWKKHRYYRMHYLENVPASTNKATLEDLLRGFFDFYRDFDFTEKGLSVILGAAVDIPEACALHIQNPVEPELNACKNVMETDLKHFQKCCEESLRTLEQSSRRTGKATEPWGILCLCTPSDNSDNQNNAAVTIGTVFSEESPLDDIGPTVLEPVKLKMDSLFDAEERTDSHTDSLKSEPKSDSDVSHATLNNETERDRTNSGS